MNFFGHAWLAAGCAGADAAFVRGAMTPDLLAMAGRRGEARAAVVAARTAEDGAHARGVRFHAATDAAFHAAPRFARLEAWAAAALRGAGLRRGPARGVAHVGLELLLDGWLVREAGVPALYREALAGAHAGEAPGLDAVCRRLAASPLPGAYADPAEVARRTATALARRPRLALAPGERDAVAAWCREAADRMTRHAEALLQETRRGLAAAERRRPEATEASPPRW